MKSCIKILFCFFLLKFFLFEFIVVKINVLLVESGFILVREFLILIVVISVSGFIFLIVLVILIYIGIIVG